MHIERKISQHRRDFRAKLTCEHCGNSVIRNGYDDAHFHNKVIPAMQCTVCGRISETAPTSTPDVNASDVL